jgi:hypothetical protein
MELIGTGWNRHWKLVALSSDEVGAFITLIHTHPLSSLASMVPHGSASVPPVVPS